MGYQFDGPNKRVILTTGTTEIVLTDLYSRYKDWVRDGNNAGYENACLTVGGDIPAIPLYLFLSNGWRIIPQPANHTLTVTGGVLEVEGGGDPFVDPPGSYKIRINRQAPGIAIGYSSGGSGSGPSAGTIADAVWSHGSAQTLADRLLEVWSRLGLDPARPLIQNQTQISFGAVLLALSESSGTVTVSRA